MNEKNVFTRLVQKHGVSLIALAALVAPMTQNVCRFLWNQPRIPDGLDQIKRGK